MSHISSPHAMLSNVQHAQGDRLRVVDPVKQCYNFEFISEFVKIVELLSNLRASSLVKALLN